MALNRLPPDDIESYRLIPSIRVAGQGRPRVCGRQNIPASPSERRRGMIPGVHGDENALGFARYTLTRTEDGHVWGVCAEAEGLFGESQRGTYEFVRLGSGGIRRTRLGRQPGVAGAG